MTNKELFERINENHSEKKIKSLTNKLIKKCSFNSGKDAENLCHLAYWLFIYGYINDVHEIYEITLNAEFPGKGYFAVWDFLFYIWGLEVYLLKDSGKVDEAEKIIDTLDKYMSSSPISQSAEIERRNRFTYEYIVTDCEKRIENCDTRSFANGYRLTALFRMIGYTYTGLFPNLLEDEERISEKINEYVSLLKQ